MKGKFDIIKLFTVCYLALSISIFPEETKEKLLILAPTPSKYFTPYLEEFRQWYMETTGENIDVSYIQKGGNDCVKYIEEQLKEPKEDLVISLKFTEIESLRKNGYLKQYEHKYFDKIPEMLFDKLYAKNSEGYYTGFSLSAYGIMINTDVLKKDQLKMPKGYRDIAFDSGYIGQLVLGNPILSSISQGNFEVILSHYGWIEGWKEIFYLASKISEFTATTGEANKKVAAGKAAAVFTKYSYWYEFSQKGAPVKWIWPDEGTNIYILYSGILKGSKNEKNARLFTDWIMSQEGQTSWIKYRNETPIRSDINLPKDMPSVVELYKTAKYETNFSDELVEKRHNTVTDIFLKVLGYHSEFKNKATDEKSLDNYVERWIIGPKLDAENEIRDAEENITKTDNMNLDEKGVYYREIAHSTLSNAKEKFAIYNYDDAEKLAKNSYNASQLAIAYQQRPKDAYEIILYLSLGLLTVIAGSFLFTYLRRQRLEELSKQLQKEVDQKTKELINEKEKLRIYNISLESEIKARRKYQEELIKARKIAEKANQAKSDFLANMSHEIRTPINAVIGMTYLALKTKLTPKQKNYISKIEIASKTLLALINDILDFEKIEAGRLDIEEERFDIHEIIGDISNIASIKSSDKNIDFFIKQDIDIPRYLMGDSLRISQILINLVNNAIKFTKQGEILLEIRLLKKELNDTELEFKVKDTGIGMTPEQLKSLFQPFIQADASITRKYGGTGLGLIISKKIINLMNGEITVESEYGTGSTFSFNLHLRGTEDQEPRLNDFGDVAEKTLLILVGDNPMLNDILVYYLRSLKFDFILVDSYEKFRKTYDERKHINLIILDFDTFSSFKENNKNYISSLTAEADLNAIYLINYNQEEEIKSCENNNVHKILKPLTYLNLYNTIYSVFNKSKLVQADEELKVKFEDTHVLVVEDNKINQEVAKEILEQLGIKIDIAENGIAAIKKCRENNYDAVLMDLQMPEMDGYTAIKILREEDNYPIPVIAVTANVLKDNITEMKNSGFSDYVLKPINPEYLISVLKKWITSSKQTYIKEEMKKVEESSSLNTAVNIATGIKKLGGKRDLYFRLLDDFISEYEYLVPDFEKMMNENRTKDILKNLHTLKSITGNLEFTLIYGYMCSLEDNLKRGIKEYMEIFPEFKPIYNQFLSEVKEEMKKYEKKSKEIGTKTEYSYKAVNALIQSLKNAVEKSNPRLSKEILDKLAEYKLNTNLEEKLDSIKESVSNYQFEEAFEILKKIQNL